MPSSYTIEDALQYRTRVVEEIESVRGLITDIEDARVQQLPALLERLRGYVDDIEAAVPCEDGVESLARFGARDGIAEEHEGEEDHSDCYSGDDVVLTYSHGRDERRQARVISFEDMRSWINDVRLVQSKYLDRALAVAQSQLAAETFDVGDHPFDYRFNAGDFEFTTHQNEG